MKRSGFIGRARRLFASHPDFARLAGGHGLAYVTIEMWYVVLPLLVLHLRGSALWMGVVAASGYAPLLAGSAVAGWWVDGSSPRSVMLTASLSRAGVFAALALMGLTQTLTLPLLAVGCLALGFLGVAHAAGKRTMIPQLIPKGEIAFANSLDEGGFGAAEMIGTLAGGLLVAWRGPFWAMLCQAGLLVGNAAAVAGLPEAAPRPSGSPASPAPALREGFAFMFERKTRNRALLWTTVLAVLIYGACTAFLSFQVFYYGSVLRVSPREVGWMVSAVSAVALVFALTSAACVENLGVGRTFLLWSAVVAAGLFVTGASASAVVVVVGAGLLLGGAKALRGVFTTLIHWYVPRELMGRVGGVFSTFAEGAAVFAALGAGVLAKAVGLPTTFQLAGWIAVGACAVCLLSPLRSLTAKTPESAQRGPEVLPVEIADA
ncbi:MAG: MFS transporter [Elusimicrobia bacterium]|nr:MFS transporter [Elusimicrobiota bacterium]